MKLLPGVVLTFVIGVISFQLAKLPFFTTYQISPLIICILLGMLAGNLLHRQIPTGCQDGIKFSQQKLLRAGIVLYGFFITFQQIAAVGLTGLLTDLLIISITFTAGTWLGIKVLKLEPETAMLTAVGSSICGAAAILGAEPVVRSKPHQTAVAVATVVIFGTAGMFIYPLLYHSFGIAGNTMGIYTGATIHEVAQVVAAGNAMGQDIGATSVIVKLTRVMMLAPFLIVLSYYLSRKGAQAGGEKAKITIPWFALLFVVAAGINSTGLIPAEVVAILTKLSVFLLSMAMAALGIDTNISKIRGVGIRPVIQAGVIWIWLISGGYAITNGVQMLLS